jgi:PBP1b-binding outer membrane lipoprotein LpoB
MRGLFLLASVLLLAGCDSAPSVTFADAAITLPDDPLDLAPGPGMQAVVENCTACHSPSTMLQQPQISRAKWESTIDKMIEIYKAPVDPQAIPEIIDYFVAVQSAQAENTPAPAQPQLR